MIILDPERDGCHVWNGHYVSYISGKPYDVCQEIQRRVGYISIDETPQYGVQETYVQNITVRLDTKGIGMAYLDFLRDMGIRVEPIEVKNINTSLPIQLPIDKRMIRNAKILHKDKTLARY